MPQTEFEWIFVDDGGADSTSSILRDLRKTDSLVHIVLLSRGFRRQMAFMAGIEHAAGDAVVLIDGDVVTLAIRRRCRARIEDGTERSSARGNAS